MVSTDAYCNRGDIINFNATLCRQQTWKALIKIFNSGGAKAIGVSNFAEKHLNDILSMNTLIPSVNQFEFHGYWHEWNLTNFCSKYKILVCGYSPLGVPDLNSFYQHWNPTLPKHPTAIEIGNKYNKSASQIWFRWQWQLNIVLNPRTMNITHMK
eukprot:UN07124